ncbi:MAG: fibrobacter succinogenes major paralogous domain-containing protein [Chitinispirillales bacterium]|jgi:uncharacterized protein (TIGR02145 family)|nr:fibrobacter succinogenes major paralogous domain-containing protein [Chitinispirillales bacterium]
MSLFTRQRRTLLLAAAAAIVIAAHNVSYAQSGGLMGAAAPQQAAPAQQTAQPQDQYPAPQVTQPAPAHVAPPKKPDIAVYVFGAEDPALNKAAATRLIIALNNSGRYQAADNYRELFDQAVAAQKGGAAAVNFKQFRKLGEQAGVEYVCVAEITTVFGEKQMSGHILKVGVTGIAAIGAADIPFKTSADLTAAAEQLVDAMAPRSNRLGTLSDGRDGRIYKTVKVGGATWMAENLKYKTASGSWCYYGNTDSSNCEKYGGRLYDWNTATAVCPSGWHLPSRQEWKNIVATAGDSSTAGKKLKSATGWTSGNGTDNYGFAALPGGYRANNGGFDNVGNGGNWWTYTENGSAYAYALRMSSYDDSVGESYNYKDYGFSVRCVMDN